jgi:hypothetical protein
VKTVWIIVGLVVLISASLTIWFKIPPVLECPRCGRRTVDEEDDGSRVCLYCGKVWKTTEGS